jgi:hypothetical protein
VSSVAIIRHLADIMGTDELRKGMNHEHYRDAYQNLQGAIEELAQLDVGPEEREQCKVVLQTLLLWVLSLPDNLRDGLTAQEVAEAAWLHDDAVGAQAQAEHLLELLMSNGFPVRREKKSRGGEEVAVYSYELGATQANPVKFFSPLKKKYVQDTKRHDEKWVESLFWDLSMITPDAQAELQVNGGIFTAFAPGDQRTAQERASNHPPKYTLPHRSSSSTRRVHRVSYGGEVVVAERWRDEFGEEIKHTDQHFRIVYLTTKPGEEDAKLTAALKDTRVAVCRPEQLAPETRDALADLLAAEEMKKNCAAPNQGALRDYADGKRRDAIKAILKCQQDEFRRGKRHRSDRPQAHGIIVEKERHRRVWHSPGDGRLAYGFPTMRQRKKPPEPSSGTTIATVSPVPLMGSPRLIHGPSGVGADSI